MYEGTPFCDGSCGKNGWNNPCSYCQARDKIKSELHYAEIDFKYPPMKKEDVEAITEEEAVEIYEKYATPIRERNKEFERRYREQRRDR